MSRHYFKNKGYQIQAGWDRPLQYFYMVIFQSNLEGEVIYSNLYDMNAGTKTQSVDYFINKLKELDIESPDKFWERIALDKLHNTGNYEKDWDEDSAI